MAYKAGQVVASNKPPVSIAHLIAARFLAGIGLGLICQFALAGDATSCIQPGKNSTSQTLTNKCHEKLLVFWCHDRDEKGLRMALCGADRKFYQMEHVLKPGETRENKFSLPLHSKIHFGACFGSYGARKTHGNEGEFSCPAPKANQNPASTVVSTSSGKTLDSACANAVRVSGASGSFCECRAGGSMFVCRVKSSYPSPDFSVIHELKQTIREAAEAACKSNPKSCSSPRKSDPGGIRG